MYSHLVIMSAFLLGAMCGESSYEPASDKIDNFASSSIHYNSWHNPNPTGIQLQSGYEGYLVPPGSDLDGPSTFLGLSTWDIVSSLIAPFPSIILKWAFKIGFYTLGFGALFAMGAAATSAICTLTPLCSISFHSFRWDSDSVNGYVTEERVQRAAKFLFDSIEKYKKINKKKKTASPEQNEVKSIIKD